MMDGTVTLDRTLQRSRGTADVAFRADELDRLYQAGAAKRFCLVGMVARMRSFW